MSEQEEIVDTTTGEQEDDAADNDENSMSQENATPEISSKEIEKLEEEKLRAKMPMTGRPVSGHSAFLQKRLANRQKYFDSGDYQMAKQKPAAKSRQAPTGLPGYATGDCIPTPETVPVRKTSIIQTSKFSPNQ